MFSIHALEQTLRLPVGFRCDVVLCGLAYTNSDGETPGRLLAPNGKGLEIGLTWSSCSLSQAVQGATCAEGTRNRWANSMSHRYSRLGTGQLCAICQFIAFQSDQTVTPAPTNTLIRRGSSRRAPKPHRAKNLQSARIVTPKHPLR